MPSLTRHDDVFVLDLGDDENLLDPELLSAVDGLLDEVERADAPRALVTCGSGQFYSAGLDLAWIAANPGGVGDLVGGMHQLFARMLEMPVPSVAALNGHAFAGGAMLALAHDLRVMREDRGFVCLPEVDGRIAFTPGLTDLIAGRLGPAVAHEAMTTGRRYGAQDARECSIVDELASAERVLERAIALARSLAGKDPCTYGAIKACLHRRVIESLRDLEANAVDATHFARADRAA
jgi:enoyl-CoA hydratase/carnithine racemase